MADEPLRICLLTYRGNPRSGGQGVYVRLLSNELAALGHHVDVWSGPPYPELSPGVGFIRVPSLDLWNEPTLFRWPGLHRLRDPINRSEWAQTLAGRFPEPLTFSERVARIFNKGKTKSYDIVHDNQCLGPGLLRLRKNIPVVATIHHPITIDRRIAYRTTQSMLGRYGLWRWYSFLPIQQKVSRRLDRILTVSQASLQDLQHEYGIPSKLMRVVGNGIDFDVFRPMPEIERRQDQLITTLSADSPLKGFKYLLEALTELYKTRPELRLTVIGTPCQRTERKVARLGLQSVVHFTGRVEAEEITRAYARSTIAVVPSLYEGFGFPAGEAMACEVPVVSTSAGALPEVVGTDCSCGMLVRPGNAGCLARAISELLDAKERRDEMGKAGRRRVLMHFTWRKTTERTLAVYREAIAERALN
ncbi:MAG: glycosyltransferase family 4 protein [Deltaproteobacteria bacterium]|nr:glycosyltransferase family 4 protein [Deltaproteobacteria bacterium]